MTAAMLEDLADLVGCESPSADLTAVGRSAEVVAAVGERRMGTSPEVVLRDGCSHLRWRFGAGDRVLLLGHHDTVWPVGSLDDHPWRVSDGLAYGPGCFDMKAGLVQMFHAVAGLDDPDGVTVLVTGDEELGAPTSRALVEQEARLTGAVLVGEGSADGGALKSARNGVSLYHLTVHGRAAHAGLEPHAGANASVELAHAVLAVAALDEGPGRCTVTPTLLTSGTSANTVPALAGLAVDVRCPTRADQDRVDRRLRDLRPVLAGTGYELVRRACHPPLEAAASAQLLALAREVAEDLGDGPIPDMRVGGASDGNLAAGTGAATLDGLGAVGGNAHAPGEHVVLAAMPRRSRLLTGMAARILAGWSPPMNPRAADGGGRR